MSDDNDNEILRLEYLYKIQAKPAKTEKKPKTIQLSASVHKKVGIWDRELSAMIEEDLIKRLRAAGHLPTPLEALTPPTARGAYAYFNPSKDEPAPDYILDSPFKGDTPVGKILKEKDEKKGKRPKK